METTKMKIEYRKLTDNESDPWLSLTNIDELIWNGVYALRVIDDDGSLGLPFQFENDETVTLVLKDHAHEGLLQNARTIVQTITRVERSTGNVFTYTRTRYCVDGKHRWNSWELAAESDGNSIVDTEVLQQIIGYGLNIDADGKVTISDNIIDENKLTNELNYKINEASKKSSLADVLIMNDGIHLHIGALNENSDPYTGTRYAAYTDKIFSNGETVIVNTGYKIVCYKLFDAEQEVFFVSNLNESTLVLEEKGYCYQIEFAKENHSTFIDTELHKVVKSFIREPIIWDANKNLNSFVAPGNYNISGSRSNSSDGLPTTDIGNFAAQLTVLICENYVMQKLMLLSATSGAGNVYMRTKQGTTWGTWKTLF